MQATPFKKKLAEPENLVGIGLRGPHMKQVLKKMPNIGWLEIHSENFFPEKVDDSNLQILHNINNHYQISMHGLELSLGSASGLCKNHLAKLKTLSEEISPLFISDHLSWNRIGGHCLPDLLPIPYNTESMNISLTNLEHAQEFIKREILIENPSSYIEYSNSTYQEVDFLVTLVRKAGSHILLDVNNVYITCYNLGYNAYQYIDQIPTDLVKEIHIAGCTSPGSQKAIIDTHNSAVSQEVWNLYKYAIKRFGLIHTLLEWDKDLPQLEYLTQHARQALVYLNSAIPATC